ncbi:phage tail protein [Rhodospira trueperi]|uniref:Phage tail-collar fibre protein n=1 Tax=Rhodospira trueperi TaxID=69960 RepID=A0A1G7D1W6_9PROT|nr:phage tail protein [Rhodospira trueperi]SDE45684.1 Phage tail-collar fibre protein [Rhodospira trueperi]
MSSEYCVLLTATGQAKIANALALGTVVEVTHMAVGDGGGAPITPAETMTALVGETYRAAIETLEVDPDNPAWMRAQMIIPTDTGGWWVREVGLFDAVGDLIAVANYPASYKPVLADGATRDMAIKLVLEVSSTSAITLIADTSVIVATRPWVLSQLPPHATTEMRGLVELATPAECRAGTDTERAVTPSGLWAGVAAATAVPLAALPFPEIVTSTHRLSVTPAAGADGGTVAVAAGTPIVMGTEGATAGRGHLVTVETPAWQSADLAADSTYYLRGRVEGGALVLYTQQGTDTDAVPASLTGTPDGAAGGGFDSTPVDMLIARVETGTAGTVPTVTPLANAARLHATAHVTATGVVYGGSPGSWDWALALDWARTPATPMLSLLFHSFLDGGSDDDWQIDTGLDVSRYAVSGTPQQDSLQSPYVPRIAVEVMA